MYVQCVLCYVQKDPSVLSRREFLFHAAHAYVPAYPHADAPLLHADVPAPLPHVRAQH
jgi:hypothetical protein